MTEDQIKNLRIEILQSLCVNEKYLIKIESFMLRRKIKIPEGEFRRILIGITIEIECQYKYLLSSNAFIFIRRDRLRVQYD